MTTWTSKIKYFAQTMGAIIGNLNHYQRPDVKAAPFGVWYETGRAGGSLYTDNKPGEQVAAIDLDYFTQTEFDPVIDQIQAAFVANGWRFDLTAVLFEDDNRLIHYSWSVEVADNGIV